MMNKLLRVVKLVNRCYSSSVLADNVENNHTVIVRKHGTAMIIGLNRPEKRNALNTDSINRLEAAFDDFENDDRIKAAVIFGEGGCFCSGYDLEELADSSDIPSHYIHNNLTKRYMKKPMIAAITGYAVGAGLDLALMCDIRVMEETAIIGCLSRRYGMTMSESGIYRLLSMAGVSGATDMLLTGKTVKAEEAYKFNIVNRIAECGTSIGMSLSMALELAKIPQAALIADRAMLYKYAFANAPFVNNDMNKQSVPNKDDILKDIRRGSQLFKNGMGKHGKIFSSNAWQSYDVHI